MKTLIFNGSPRKNGTSSGIIKLLTPMLSDYEIISAYNSGISPCTDCRFCRKNDFCKIDDDMQRVYKSTVSADTIIIVSPVYYSALTGELLSVFSRYQLFFSSRFFNNSRRYFSKPKCGILILSAGGSTKDFSPVIASAEVIFKEINADLKNVIICSNTDSIPFENNNLFMAELERLSSKLGAC